jgi:hypothetical protein
MKEAIEVAGKYMHEEYVTTLIGFDKIDGRDTVICAFNREYGPSITVFCVTEYDHVCRIARVATMDVYTFEVFFESVIEERMYFMAFEDFRKLKGVPDEYGKYFGCRNHGNICEIPTIIFLSFFV